MRVILLACCLFLTKIDVAQRSSENDSAIIILKNVSRDTFKCIYAVIKGQHIISKTLKPNEEYQKKICTDCWREIKHKDSTCEFQDTNVYRFGVYYLDGSQLKIEPIDYTAQVSQENITTGTYIYYIDSPDKDAEDDGLHVKLKKLK